MSALSARRPSALVVAILLGALTVLAVISVLAAGAAGGGNLVLRGAGAMARAGAPVSAMLADLAAAVTLGGAVVAGWLLHAEADRARVMTAVAVAAGITTLARGTSLAFSYAVATGQAVGSVRFGSDLEVFLATDLGVWLVSALVIAAAATTIAVAGTSRGIARTVAVAAGLVAFASAMTGHAGGGQNHEVATSTMLIHLLAVGIWLGGLAVLQLLPSTARDDATVVRGFSHLALICWIALAVSGVWALSVRMNAPSEVLTSAYVQLGLAKAVLLVALGGLGVIQRRQLATGFAAEGPGHRAAGIYRRLAVLELALMGLAVAIAAAMSSSPPPAAEGIPPAGPAGILTGYPLPAAPDLGTVLTAWRPAPFGMMLACVLLLVWWRPRGPQRTRSASIRLVLGAAVLVALTSGPLNVYSKVLVSAHLLQHVLLLAVVGVLLGTALAVPARLRRALSGRHWLAALVAGAPVALLAGVYAGPLLRIALEGHAGHLVLQVLALTGGAVVTFAVRSLAGVRARILVIAVPLALAVAGAVVLLSTDTLIAASWFGATGRRWWPDALADQQRGGIAVAVVSLAAAAVAALAVRRPASQRSR
ncbi:CopD family protein [Brachybacterium sp. GCM10030268]|uniref:CopD family protein n=1 Tax=Brachybacterium sp. GCM10030268 TaxID=3273382 RepID=UPI0036063B38